MRWRTAKKYLRGPPPTSGRAAAIVSAVRPHQLDKHTARVAVANCDWWRPFERPTWAEGRRRLAEYRAHRADGFGRFDAVRAVRERRPAPGLTQRLRSDSR